LWQLFSRVFQNLKAFWGDHRPVFPPLNSVISLFFGLFPYDRK
jgi:hypothetical protein